MQRRILVLTSLLLILAVPALAQVDDGPALDALDDLTQDDLTGTDSRGSSWLDFLRTLGLVVFTTPFNTHDGLGDGPYDPTEIPPTAFGHRPTLQGNGLHLRINGLDAQSCNECHSLVSHATIPPRLGIGGAGTVAQSAFPAGTLLDIADTFDNRVQYYPGHDPDLPMVRDGVADYNGRFINAPFLFGGGGVELIAKEMTRNLQALLEEAREAPPGTVVSLDTHGTHFGSLTKLLDGSIAADLQGIGLLEDLPLEKQLVVRPFGRKGDAFTMRDFDRGAMQFHFGMQPVEVDGVGNTDEDRDGVYNEVRIVEMSVLHIFDVTNPRPEMKIDSEAAKYGYKLFHKIGCVKCHRSKVTTEERYLPLAFPEIEEDPWANVYFFIDLVDVGFDPAPNGGVYVPLFSDLKRHDMGPDLAETCEGCPVANEDFITARLWGIADTAPYLHDGRATTLYQAISMHGGEADPVKNTFLGLPQIDQIRIIAFLKSLRNPENPNEDILP